MKKKDFEDLRKEMSRRKFKKIKSSLTKAPKEDFPGGKQKEGPPKETDEAYDRNDPKYFMKDISEEVKDLLQHELPEQQRDSADMRTRGLEANPRSGAQADLRAQDPPSKFSSKSVRFQDIRIDGNFGYDILKDVSQSKANVTIGELLKESAFYRN